MELLILLVCVAVCGYAYGVDKPKRERRKRQEAEYNRQWEEWRVKYKAVEDEHGKWHATTNPDQGGT